MKNNIPALLVLHASAVFALTGQAQRLNNVHFTEKSPLGTRAATEARAVIQKLAP